MCCVCIAFLLTLFILLKVCWDTCNHFLSSNVSFLVAQKEFCHVKIEKALFSGYVGLSPFKCLLEFSCVTILVRKFEVVISLNLIPPTPK